MVLNQVSVNGINSGRVNLSISFMQWSDLGRKDSTNFKFGDFILTNSINIQGTPVKIIPFKVNWHEHSDGLCLTLYFLQGH